LITLIKLILIKLPDILIFENDDLIVLNKPSGLLSIPDREGKEISLKKILREKYGEIFTIHRLDKGTSGLIVFAKNDATHKLLSQQFENRVSEKIYLGLITGSPLYKKGTIDSPIMEHPVKKGLMVINRKGKESLTDYEILKDFGIYCWTRFQIYTGRTHQIRVHMKDFGHPIVCDELYGDAKPVFLSAIKHKFKLSKNVEEERPILNRLALHSWQLRFTGPGQKPFDFEAPVPKDLKAILQQLSKIKGSAKQNSY
jgi:23S rRNA pseudouridine955/2504/2580 synthase/23S rRNA pseudouridine1911/1915/1917 synthase